MGSQFLGRVVEALILFCSIELGSSHFVIGNIMYGNTSII